MARQHTRTKPRLRLPVARSGLVLVRGEEEKASCAACGEPAHLVEGLYEHVVGECEPGNENLHDTAVDALAQILRDRIARSGEFEALHECAVCNGTNTFHLAAPGRTVHVEHLWVDGVRPDILVREADGAVCAVVEVVVSNDVSEEKAARYREAGVPLVRVWPSWRGLAAIAGGLGRGVWGKPSVSVRAENKNGHKDFGSLVENVQCSHVRHPKSLHPVTCECGAQAMEVALEVVSGSCYKCHSHVPVLDVLVLEDGALMKYLPSNPDIPPGVEGPAAEMGVSLRITGSKTARAEYLMHTCPKCGAGQGNFFLADHFDGPNEVDLDVDRRVYNVCSTGHWVLVDATPWGAPEDAESMYDACLDNAECFDEYGPCGMCPRQKRFNGMGVIDWG